MSISSKNKITILVFLLLIVIAIITYFFLFNNNNYKNKLIKSTENRNGCLEEDKIAGYEIKKKENEVSIADIIISNKNNGQEQYRFQIELPLPGHYHPIELHNCNVYAVKTFGYDYSNHTSLPGYKAEIWKYDYDGNGEKLVLLDEDALGNLRGYRHYFSSDFRIDFQEKYIVLLRGYLDEDAYSLIIKDLNTKKDVFVFLMKKIAEQYPNIAGSFGLDQWTKDSRYFWGDIFDGAYVNAYFRIDTQNWKTDIYETPDGAMGGSPLNISTGYLPIQPGQVWAGDYQLTQELKEQYRKEGKKSQLYLYNLFTKEKILIETTEEPLFWFKPRWLSDTQLEYQLPDGEKRIYEIK